MSITNDRYSHAFSVRITKEMEEMIEYLQERKLLNKTAVIRSSVAEEYKREKNREKDEYYM